MIYIKNLLEIDSQIIDGSKRYFCIVRKSYVLTTPEEKVRQNFLKYLIEIKKFPVHRIKVEESLAHYNKGNTRIDILILDSNDLPFFIYECKKENEYFTDDVFNQALGYFEKLETVEYLGIVIGNELELVKYQEKTPNFINVEQPDLQMINSDKDIIIEEEEFKYIRNKWEIPVEKEVIDNLINYGIIGEGTDEIYHSFLVNFDGWLLDEKDKLTTIENIEDIGIKTTKFGSAGGGFFAKEYRSFLIKDKIDKPIVCFSLTQMQGGISSPIGTVIMVGVETVEYKNSSLELRIGKSLKINDKKIIIEHNGTITVGKFGASKKQDLIDFVNKKNPKLVKNNKVFLGSFDVNTEINSTNVNVFIKNMIEYALIRNDFRKLKKEEKLKNKK